MPDLWTPPTSTAAGSYFRIDEPKPEKPKGFSFGVPGMTTAWGPETCWSAGSDAQSILQIRRAAGGRYALESSSRFHTVSSLLDEVGAEQFVPVEQSATFRADKAGPQEMDALEWFSRHLPELRQHHTGQWIAIAHNRLIAAADALPELLRQAQEAKVERPFITQVPTKPSTWNTAYAKQNL